MFKEMDKIVNDFFNTINTMIAKHKCSSCGSTEFEENFTLDCNFDVCDKCYKENEGK